MNSTRGHDLQHIFYGTQCAVTFKRVIMLVLHKTGFPTLPEFVSPFIRITAKAYELFGCVCKLCSPVVTWSLSLSAPVLLDRVDWGWISNIVP